MVGEGGACRLCFDSIHPLTFVLEDASGWMGSIKTKSTAPPHHFFFPRPCLAHFVTNFSTWGPVCRLEKRESKYTLDWHRAVIKRWGWGFPTATMNVSLGCFRRKIEEK